MHLHRPIWALANVKVGGNHRAPTSSTVLLLSHSPPWPARSARSATIPPPKAQGSVPHEGRRCEWPRRTGWPPSWCRSRPPRCPTTRVGTQACASGSSTNFYIALNTTHVMNMRNVKGYPCTCWNTLATIRMTMIWSTTKHNNTVGYAQHVCVCECWLGGMDVFTHGCCPRQVTDHHPNKQ